MRPDQEPATDEEAERKSELVLPVIEASLQVGRRTVNELLGAGFSQNEIEPSLRSDWEARDPNSKWERFKDSVKHAFSGRK